MRLDVERKLARAVGTKSSAKDRQEPLAGAVQMLLDNVKARERRMQKI